jgi:hypothetical protein
MRNRLDGSHYLERDQGDQACRKGVLILGILQNTPRFAKADDSAPEVVVRDGRDSQSIGVHFLHSP